jgi:Golgi phosphoprotein 3
MSSTLQRRRVAGSTNNESTSGNGSPGRNEAILNEGGARGEYNEDGHKVAFDPQDINATVEDLKQPRLTLMEEVLLL